MTAKMFSNALGKIEESYVDEAVNYTANKKNNVWISFVILLAFAVIAYPVNVAFGCNYMFLMRGDGTPYDILFNLLKGHAVVYPAAVVLLFLAYISGFPVRFMDSRSCRNRPEEIDGRQSASAR